MAAQGGSAGLSPFAAVPAAVLQLRPWGGAARGGCSVSPTPP